MAEKRNPTEHRMTRRSQVNDYSQRGMYHITLRVAEDNWRPFGRVVGDASLPDGCDGAPHVELSVIGEMVRHELLNSIRTYYPMVEVQDYVVMPEHIHFILEVHETLVSRQGRKAHLGQVIAGFKKGCNRWFWALTGQESADEGRRGKPAGTNTSGGMARADAGGAIGAVSCPAVCPQGYKVPSRSRTGRPVLFSEGYVDVMPLQSGQLQRQRIYIRNNPRSRLLRSTYRSVLQPIRGGIDTALSIRALEKYLRRECSYKQFAPDIWEGLRSRLLTMGNNRRGKPAGTDGSSTDGSGTDGSSTDGSSTDGSSSDGSSTDGNGTDGNGTGGSDGGAIVDCDSYGNRELLKRRLLPVVCHRCDAGLFEQQKARCLMAAQEGAVLVSARISKGEQAIIDTAQRQGYPVVLLIDNGIPDIYHPSEVRMEQCQSGQLLMVTPWCYHYRSAEESISVAECKAMNCVVQALCRKRDDWWKS